MAAKLLFTPGLCRAVNQAPAGVREVPHLARGRRWSSNLFNCSFLPLADWGVTPHSCPGDSVPSSLEIPVLYIKHLFIFNKLDVFKPCSFFKQQRKYSYIPLYKIVWETVTQGIFYKLLF